MPLILSAASFAFSLMYFIFLAFSMALSISGWLLTFSLIFFAHLMGFLPDNYLVGDSSILSPEVPLRRRRVDSEFTALALSVSRASRINVFRRLEEAILVFEWCATER